ncbi:MAG TPA: molybdopterin-dependent oxidoreductase [Stellaceae bacterium]|nr:molybdopterin-dependent oxidoreductase [Stellaceae bacterium]
MIDRRLLLKGGLGAAAALAVSERVLANSGEVAAPEAIAGKDPLLKRSYRPPNYETPIEIFQQDFTPNRSFFVRYHLAGIPDKIDAASWRLRVEGEAVTTPLDLSLEALRNEYEPVEIAAVCQCSGNRRGFSTPQVPGVQWGSGAMGNALWKGARLKDILAKAELRKDAVEIVVDGADEPVLEQTPDFVKSLPVWKALDENTIVAYAMNGEALPHFNGFPVRLVVPGWTATYWMKHLTKIVGATKPFDGFWMKSAYRIPVGKFPVVDRFQSQESATATPITEMVVNSLVTGPASARVGQAAEVSGIAWDGGYGITGVEVSLDNGRSWQPSQLGPDHGRFAFRRFTYGFTPKAPGRLTVMARASNRIGQTQVNALIFNPAGYHNNVIEPVDIMVKSN